jgi:hypothetical protein
MKPMTERPLASAGLTSYRYRGFYGWIMIGARSVADALSEARRSHSGSVDVVNLQVWDGNAYASVVPSKEKSRRV